MRQDISVFPLAIPLITGTGAMTTVVVQTDAAPTFAEKSLVMAAIVLTFPAICLIFRFSEYMERSWE